MNAEDAEGFAEDAEGFVRRRVRALVISIALMRFARLLECIRGSDDIEVSGLLEIFEPEILF